MTPEQTNIVAALALLSLLAPATILAHPTRQHATGRVLNIPSTVRGFVGGEAHDAYRLDARKGERLAVRITWRREHDNRAEVTISASDAFETAEPLSSGSWSADGRQWTGTVAETGPIYVYVVAHPSAHYTLRVRRLSARGTAQTARIYGSSRASDRSHPSDRSIDRPRLRAWSRYEAVTRVVDGRRRPENGIVDGGPNEKVAFGLSR